MKKTKKYAFVVNLVDVETPADLMARFADAKQAAGLPMNDAEYAGLIARTCELATPCITIYTCDCTDCICKPVKKLPWYKRLWNKLRGKK